MNKQKDYLLLTVKALIIVLGLWGVLWAVNKYWTQRQTQWEETITNLTDIKGNERTRNKQNEYFLSLTYEYTVDNKTYTSYKEEILNNEDEIERKTEEIRLKNEKPKIYYNIESPGQSTFNFDETTADISLILVLAPTLLIIARGSYWLFKVKYEHYYKT